MPLTANGVLNCNFDTVRLYAECNSAAVGARFPKELMEQKQVLVVCILLRRSVLSICCALRPETSLVRVVLEGHPRHVPFVVNTNVALLPVCKNLLVDVPLVSKTVLSKERKLGSQKFCDNSLYAVINAACSSETSSCVTALVFPEKLTITVEVNDVIFGEHSAGET
jgi:hypothetical protein